MNIEAVIFDWGGTLTPWHTIDAYECWFSVTGDEPTARALMLAEQALWEAGRDHRTSASVDAILDTAHFQATEEQRRRYYDWWDQHTVTDPQATGVLTELRSRGLKIGVLSNTIWPRVEHERIFVRDQIDRYIDAAVYSSEINWVKPHPEAFAAILGSLHVEPAGAVFVGDRLEDDIHGAQQAGMRTVHIPHSVIPTWQTTGIAAEPDAVITELQDLIAVIDGWLAG